MKNKKNPHILLGELICYNLNLLSTNIGLWNKSTQFLFAFLLRKILKM